MSVAASSAYVAVWPSAAACSSAAVGPDAAPRSVGCLWVVSGDLCVVSDCRDDFAEWRSERSDPGIPTFVCSSSLHLTTLTPHHLTATPHHLTATPHHHPSSPPSHLTAPHRTIPPTTSTEAAAAAPHLTTTPRHHHYPLTSQHWRRGQELRLGAVQSGPRLLQKSRENGQWNIRRSFTSCWQICSCGLRPLQR